jgi:hypothetical protein
MARNLTERAAKDNAPTQDLEVETSDGDASRQIAALAYQLWVERGCPEGSAGEDWFRAEERLRARQG